MQDKISYTVNEAADACGLGRTTLYKLISEGELTPIKIGARTLIRRVDLEAMLARKLAA
ncbi:MAG: helix-turn-helix domain-containing protein [Pseudomonadota bacterium]|nr:helix-turn-helix domain-containing protein [Pseudomonadota bacterium]